MVQQSKRDYADAIRVRYHKMGRKAKKVVLDEFCQVCGYSRKHAIRLLRVSRPQEKRKPGRPPTCGDEERKVLEVIWLTANRPCSKRLRSLIPEWLPHYERDYGRLSPALSKRLKAISARSLDRLLTPVRKTHGTRGKCGTRPGTLLKHQIPIKTDMADVTRPGVMEADTVAHCGNSLDGNFVWSLTLTDVFSGWTENRAVWNKGYEGVKNAIADIEKGLPFALTGFHTDNGGEFLNHHLVRFFAERNMPVDFSRGRAYHKNDTARVEQKNFTHVRLLLGYRRIEDEQQLSPINELYAAWSLFNNYFLPAMKLTEKTKIGSRYIKKYDIPQSPYHRLMNCPDITEVQKTFLTEVYTHLSPFKLKRQIEYKQDKILKTVR